MREKGLCSAGSRTFAEITRFMNLAAILLLGKGLSLDTFAVSLTLGFVSERTTRREKVRFLIVIGLFHFLMILAGWLFGANVSRLIADYDHWIAFFLLAFLGAKMIREGLSAVQDDEVDCDLLSLRNTLMFGIALSIDALITGFSLGLVKVHLYDGSPLGNILLAAALIGTAAFSISATGILIGKHVSSKLGSKAEIFGGAILILIGLKVLYDHLL